MKLKWDIKLLIFIFLAYLTACSSPEVTPTLVSRKTLPPTWTYTPTSIPTLTPIPSTETPKETTNPTETAVPTATIAPSTSAIQTNEIGPPSTLDPLTEFPIITEIHMTSETAGWAFASNEDTVHVLHTSGGGNSWRDVTPPIESWSASIEHNEFCNPQLGEGYFLDEQRAWISTLCIDQERPQDAFTSEAMLFTTDSGSSWQMSKLPPGGKGVGYGRFVDFIDPMHGWFVIYDYAGAGGAYMGLHRTTDGGESWEAVRDTLGSSSGLSGNLAFGDTTTGVMTFKSFGRYTPLRINWTQDSGKTWEPQYLPEPEDPSTSDPTISDFECGSGFPHAFSKLEVDILVECRMLKDAGSISNEYIFSNFLYSTQDGGMSWESFPAPRGHLHLLNSNIGWILGEEIHLTVDGGKTWTKINEVTWQGQFNFIDANHGWAVARNDDEIALVRTENGGRAWIIVEPQLVP
jgi:photosystem II stability/assembly factor-like uncharacterized protein